MKKNKRFYLMALFIFMMLFTNRVYAQSVSYGALVCGSQRWDAFNANCKFGDDNSAVAERDGNQELLSFNFTNAANNNDSNSKGKKSTGPVLSTNLDFSATYGCKDIQNDFRSNTATCSGSNIKHDYSAIAEYYEEVGIPNYIVVYTSGDTMYYYPSALEAYGKAGDNKNMAYYARSSIIETANVGSCDDYYLKLKKLQSIRDESGVDSTEFKNESNRIVSICNKWIDSAGVKSECYHSCVDVVKDIGDISDGKFVTDTNSCGIGKDLAAWILRILKILRYIVPVIVIVMSTLEYIGAITSANDDAMKKVGGRFSKRLLIMILIFLIPSLLQFIFNIFNIDGLSKDNPYCIVSDK